MRALVPLLLAAFLGAPALAQEQAPANRTRLIGLTFDHWTDPVGVGNAPLRPTLRLTRYRPGRLGADFAIVIFPDGLWLYPPLVTLGGQAGAVMPVRAGPVSVLLKGGGAGIVSAGMIDQWLRVIPGVQAGVGVLIPVDGKSAIRLDVTQHLYRSEGRTYALWSVGLGATGRRNGGSGSS